MRAVGVSHDADANALSCGEVPLPQLGADDVLIRLHAAGVNHVDLSIASGRANEIPTGGPGILGVEGAGEVVETPRDSRGLRAGDRVVINPMVTCGRCEGCASGIDNACAELKVVGEHLPGTCADFVAVPCKNVVPIESDLSFVDAACIFVPFLTAWHMLVSRAKLKAGETVLIVGAGSGVGTAAIQVAKVVGARVIATTGDASKANKLESLGADVTINYVETPEFESAVLDFTAGRGVDVAHDSVGNATFRKSLACLAPNGRLVGMGSHTGSVTSLPLWPVYRGERSILGAHLGTFSEAREWLPLVWSGRLLAVVDSVFELNAAEDAHRRLVSPDRFGKVALRM